MSTALVSIVDGIPTTTSQLVAETFGKRHDAVIRGIRDLQDKCPKEFTAHNFVVSEYTDNTGRKLPMYLLTRDGLTLLVMGYTGKEAMRFKLAYIEAFNCMEKQLEAMRDTPAGYLSIEDRRPLSVLIGQWAGKAKMSFPDCWRELHTVFGITTVSELPSSQLPAALAWVQAKIDGLSPSVHSDIHSDIHSNVPTMSPSVPNVPDFPMELANSGRKGDKVLNLWEELEELRMKLASCNNMVFFTCTSGRLMFLPPEKLLLHEILRDSVKQAQDSLSQAQRAVQSALRLKHRVDFHNI